MPGKRGPVPRGSYHNKSRVLSTRIREDTRLALEEAAAHSGRSLSQEIEHRLRRSFDQDEKVIIKYGSRRNYAVLRLIANLMELNSERGEDGHPKEWLDSPYAFWQLVSALSIVFSELAPPEPGKPAADQAQHEAENDSTNDAVRDAAVRFPNRGAMHARFMLLSRVKDAKADALPAFVDPNDLSPFIRSDLGPVAERISEENSAEFERLSGDWLRRVIEWRRTSATLIAGIASGAAVAPGWTGTATRGDDEKGET